MVAGAPNPADALNLEIYRLCLPSLEMTRLTEGGRISYIGASGDLVIVANGRPPDTYDQLERFHLGKRKFLAIPGLGRPAAFSPAVNPDKLIAYVRTISKEDGSFLLRLKVWDWKRKRSRSLMKTKEELWNPAWGPRRQLAVLHLKRPEKPHVNHKILLFDRWQLKSRIAIKGRPTYLVWKPTSPWIAVSFTGNRTLLIDSRTPSRRRMIKGWRPSAWSPDGRRLLLYSDSKTAISRANEPKKVRLLGETSTRIFAGEWLGP